MGRAPDGDGYITVTLTPEGIEAIAAAVVRKLREEGLGSKTGRATAVNDEASGKARESTGRALLAYFTETEAAEYLRKAGLSFSVATLRKQRMQGGGVPFLKFKTRVRYRKEDIDEWLNRTRVRKSTSDTGDK